MSREIKFRAWDIKSKRYRDSIPVVEQWWDSDCWDDSEQALEHPYVALDVGKQFAHRLIWEQYTGLKDRNGKEIYEHDYVQITPPLDVPADRFVKSAIYLISWAKMGFVYRTQTPMMTGCGWISDQHVYEVVGNIHENPELLS